MALGVYVAFYKCSAFSDAWTDLKNVTCRTITDMKSGDFFVDNKEYLILSIGPLFIMLFNCIIRREKRMNMKKEDKKQRLPRVGKLSVISEVSASREWENSEEEPVRADYGKIASRVKTPRPRQPYVVSPVKEEITRGRRQSSKSKSKSPKKRRTRVTE